MYFGSSQPAIASMDSPTMKNRLRTRRPDGFIVAYVSFLSLRYVERCPLQADADRQRNQELSLGTTRNRCLLGLSGLVQRATFDNTKVPTDFAPLPTHTI